MVARVAIAAALLAAMLVSGCGQAPKNLEAEKPQPAADLEAARQAKTIEEWARANPDNGLPGHGEREDK